MPKREDETQTQYVIRLIQRDAWAEGALSDFWDSNPYDD